MTRRRRADTWPTQRIVPLPRNGDHFYLLPLEVQRELLAYVDSTPAPEVRR